MQSHLLFDNILGKAKKLNADMSNKPIIAVMGATGAQGGSTVRFLLADGGFRIRGITRNVDSPKAKELAAKGVEIAKADLDDVQSLNEAFKGAYGVFGVTNFWEILSGDKETQQGKNLVDAAKATGVKHLVWSTLDRDTDPVVPHFRSKAAVDDYIKEVGVPHTSFYTSFYYENFINVVPFKKDKGTIIADWPLFISDGPIAGYAVEDTGAYVLEAFKKPEEWIGKDMRVQADVFTPRQFVEACKTVSGQEIVLTEVSRAGFEAARSFPNVEELWCNLEFFYKANGIPNRDLELTKKIYPNRQTYSEFVSKHLDAFPVLN